jgi:hypothetical protein
MGLPRLFAVIVGMDGMAVRWVGMVGSSLMLRKPSRTLRVWLRFRAQTAIFSCPRNVFLSNELTMRDVI